MKKRKGDKSNIRTAQRSAFGDCPDSGHEKPSPQARCEQCVACRDPITASTTFNNWTYPLFCPPFSAHLRLRLLVVQRLLALGPVPGELGR